MTSVASFAPSVMMTSTALMTSKASLTSKLQNMQALCILSGFLGLSHLDSLFLWDLSLKIQIFWDIWHPLFWGCGDQSLALVWDIRVKSQMPTTTEHAFKERSTKFLILLPFRTIYKRTFQYKTPCKRPELIN